MEFVPMLAMLALVKKVIDFFKYVTNKDMNGIVTTAGAWVAGVVVVLGFAQSDFASGLRIGDSNVAALNFASLVIIGMTIGASAGVANDVISSRQPSDDPARLKLLPNAAPATRTRRRRDDGAADTRTIAWVALALAVVVLLIIIL